MRSLLNLLNLRDNPVFHRFRRSQLRLKASLAWLLLTLIVTSFVVTLPYIIQTTNFDRPEQGAARNLWIPLLIIQGLILLLKGTARTASGLIQDKIDQTLDYQRLTPLMPLKNIVGYLLGLPILEYAMFALTLPHLAFIVIKGNIPLTTVLSVYTAFFVCTIFYHMTAVAVGMVMKRWIFGYLLSIFSVAFLNLILAPLGSQLGLKFMQYLSVFPVIGEKVAPLIDGPNFPGGPGSDSVFEFAEPVPFFNWLLSPFLFTLLLQGSLIVTFATMAVRRWQKADKHSLSKLYALGVLSVFIVLIIGNTWPIITGQFLPYAIFGSINLAERVEPIAIGLPLVYCMAVWLLCIFLFFNTVPTHQDYVRGLRRAKKLGRRSARPWDDDSANIAFMSLFVVIALAGFALLFFEMQSAGFMRFLAGTGYAEWRMPLALGLALLYTLLLLLVLETRGAVLSFLLVWLVPILVAIVSTAAMEDVTRFQTIVASLSPLATLLMTGMLPAAEAYAPLSAASDVAVLVTGVYAGFGFLVLQIALLGWRWQRLRRRLH
jgi:hypothetical protein